MRKSISLPILSEAIKVTDLESGNYIKNQSKFYKVINIFLKFLKHSARIGAVFTGINIVLDWFGII